MSKICETCEVELNHTTTCYRKDCPILRPLPIAHMDGLPAHKRQVGGTHYKDMRIQPSEFIVANGIGWYAGNAIKYLTRFELKGNAIEDLEKAKHYIDLLIESKC